LNKKNLFTTKISNKAYLLFNLSVLAPLGKTGVLAPSLSDPYYLSSFLVEILRNMYSGGQNKVGQVLLRNLAKIELSKPGLLTKRIWDKFQNSPNMYSITQDMANLPPPRLKSRKPLWKEEFLMEPFSKSDYWKAAWQDVDIFNKNLIEDPTKQLPGFDLPRKIWCKLNRFRTGHGKCNNMLFHWNIRENPSCECGAEKETIQHIVEECPLTKFQQGFSKLHLLTEDALNWLQQIKNI
jgi:hypothetical protein